MATWTPERGSGGEGEEEGSGGERGRKKEGGGGEKGEWKEKECEDHSHQSLKDQLSIFLIVIVQNFKQAIQCVLWVRLRYMHLPGSLSGVSYTHTHTHLQELDHLLPSHVNHVPQDHRKLLRSLSPL